MLTEVSLDKAMLGFKSKKGEVLNHWIAFVDGFNYSPQEFYLAVEKALAERKIPSMDITRVEFAEGGLLSDRRVYLRMLRERLAFDTCAAPFGTGFFFSCRTVMIPVVVKLWHLLLLNALFGLVYMVLVKPLGIIFASIAVASLIVALCQVFRNTVSLGISDLDATLIKAPVIGPIYERWFRKDTYYRQDARLVFLEIVPKLIRELAEEVVAVNGVKLVRQYQLAPVLGELYKPLAPSEKATNN